VHETSHVADTTATNVDICQLNAPSRQDVPRSHILRQQVRREGNTRRSNNKDEQEQIGGDSRPVKLQQVLEIIGLDTEMIPDFIATSEERRFDNITDRVNMNARNTKKQGLGLGNNQGKKTYLGSAIMRNSR